MLRQLVAFLFLMMVGKSTQTIMSGLGSTTVWSIYAVGSTVYAGTNAGLSISTDGGVNYNKLYYCQWAWRKPGFGVYVIGSTVYAGTNAGVSISTNGGTSYTKLYFRSGINHCQWNICK